MSLSDNINPTEFTGKIEVGGYALNCAVLLAHSGSPKRVVAENDLIGFLTGRKKGGLYKFLKPLNLQPFFPNYLKVEGALKIYKFRSGRKKMNGITVNDVTLVCNAYRNGKVAGALHHAQEHIAEKCDLLAFTVSKTTLNDLIDQATSFNKMQVKVALEKAMINHVADMRKLHDIPVPLQLFEDWFRLNNWEWTADTVNKKESVLVNWLQDLVYDRIETGQLIPLKRGKKPAIDNKSFHLKEKIIQPELCEFFGGMTALAKATSNWRKYCNTVNRVFPK